MMPITAKKLLSRLTGLSIFGVGANWIPPVDEQDKARRLLVFLSDRRALFEPFNVETDILVNDSVLEIRKRIVSDLESVDRNSRLGETLSALAAACRKFLTETGARHHRMDSYDRYHHGGDPEFFRSLGELRAFFGVHIAVLAYVYKLGVEGELTTILPPEIETRKRGVSRGRRSS